jgi:hypothetical protein
MDRDDSNLAVSAGDNKRVIDTSEKYWSPTYEDLCNELQLPPLEVYQSDATKNRVEPSNNIPVGSDQNIQLALLGQCGIGSRGKNGKQRRYTKAQKMVTLAVEKYKSSGRGITYCDLLSKGLAYNKDQAQTTLKHSLRKNTLFTLGNCKPQIYYPSCLKSKISRKNIPIEPTGGQVPQWRPFTK